MNSSPDGAAASSASLDTHTAWCWLTRAGLAVTGLRYAPSRPALARLAHIRAVLAVRLSLQGIGLLVARPPEVSQRIDAVVHNLDEAIRLLRQSIFGRPISSSSTSGTVTSPLVNA